ncbi:MAG: protein kinase [bacterium]|nr:protein kinase [bacterium]
MAKCPKCKKTVKKNATQCPKCGHALREKTGGTLDIQKHYATESPAADANSTLDVDLSAVSDDQSPDGLGTLDLDVAANSVAKSTDTASTLDVDLAQGSESEDLETEFTIDAEAKPESLPGARTTRQDIEATLDMNGTDTADSQDESRLGATMDSMATMDLQSDSSADSDSVDTDNQSTIALQGDQGPAQAGRKTRGYGSQELSEARGSRGKSGTAGRIRRLWEDAAGSSQNPMHTLKREEALATDSVFERIAERALTTDSHAELSRALGKGGKECIEMACRKDGEGTADYDLVAFLGKGAMGIVLKARQKSIGRDVAIKMIQPGAGGTKSNTNMQKKRFFYEAQITGMLDHPNIVPVYDLGISNAVLFYSMKLITGVEWQDAMSEKTREENVDILMKVADAMAFSHKRHIIHRDLKPENIMIGAFGEVLVTDWGCAVDLSRNESYGLAGSPAWMAPEMALHQVAKIGPCSDIYLLGAMLYWVVAGRPPHPGNTLTECLSNVSRNVITPVESDDPLLDIAYRAMESDPAERYQTVEEMQEAIKEYRRHAESIQLTERSEISLKHAVQSKDYEGFSRSIFGFQEAIDLWPDNKSAHSGLLDARLAYGRAAFAKNDYDLCLQTLDENVPAENELRLKAAKAQRAAQEREARFRNLRRAFAAVVLLGLGISSVLAVIANAQRKKAERQESIAIANAELAQKNETLAVKNYNEAEQQRQEAERQKLEAERQKLEAERQKGIAEMNEMLAKDNEREAKENELEAKRQKGIADQNAALARKNEAEARTQQALAEERARQVELGVYQSQLALALGRVEQNNLAVADATLDQLLDDNAYQSLMQAQKQPLVRNWAWRRINLLSNRELLTDQPFGDQLTAVGFAAKANLGAIAVRSQEGGEIHLVELRDKQLQSIGTPLKTDVPVDGLTLAPDGSEIIYSLETPSGGSTLYRWLWRSSDQPAAVAQSGSRNQGPLNAIYPRQGTIQAVAVTENHVIGGISSGMWVWKRNQNNWQSSSPTRVKRIRGKLVSIQLIEDNQALVLAELNQDHVVHLLRINESASEEDGISVEVQLLSFDTSADGSFNPSLLSAVAYSQGRIILGTSEGRLYTSPLQISANSDLPTQIGPDFVEVLPQRHQSEIRSIQVHPDGTLLTTAFEPAVYVWKVSENQQAGWSFDTDLIGIQENVGGASFMVSSSLVLGMSEGGQAIVWDVTRQKQRRRMHRIAQDGRAVNYEAPVIDVAISSDNRRAVSIDRTARLDTWDLQSGKTLADASQPTFSFVGHTPGATFSDMALDTTSNTMVTSAQLPTTVGGINSGTNWEFCRWDLQTGEMLDRWNGSQDQFSGRQVSVIDQGKLILYSSDASPRAMIRKMADGNVPTFESAAIGGVLFAVSNPASPQQAMIVKSNGAVAVFDSNSNDYVSMLDQSQRDRILADRDVALLGEWAPTGDRFYLVWASGGITEFAWDQLQLAIVRDVRNPESMQRLGLSLAYEESSEGRAGSYRLQSRWQVDLKLRQTDGINLVYLATRFPGPEGSTRLTRIAFPMDNREPIATSVEGKFPRGHIYLTDEEIPQLQGSSMTRLPVPINRIVGVRTLGSDLFVASQDGTVFRQSPDDKITAFGAPPVVAATSDADVSRVVLLHEGGILSQARWSGDTWSWSQLPTTAAGAQDVALSPNGEALLIRYADPQQGDFELRVFRGTEMVASEITEAICGTWLDNDRLALVMRNGAVTIWKEQDTQQVGSLPAETNIRPISIQKFVEPWADDQKPASEWLVVFTVSDLGKRASYLPLNPEAEVEQPEALALSPETTRISCSPREGILVAGEATGGLTVFFAAPSLAEPGTELFSLEGHSGAAIQSISFSPDGKTLVSTDSLSRLYGWLSEDPLAGVSTTLDTVLGEPADTIR